MSNFRSDRSNHAVWIATKALLVWAGILILAMANGLIREAVLMLEGVAYTGRYQAMERRVRLLAYDEGDRRLAGGGGLSSRMEAKDGNMRFDFAGSYTNISQHKLIEASFGDRTLLVEFEDGPEGATVRETFDTESTHSIEQQRDGWQAILDIFAHRVEGRRQIA